jgi:hypothetical protein
MEPQVATDGFVGRHHREPSHRKHGARDRNDPQLRWTRAACSPRSQVRALRGSLEASSRASRVAFKRRHATHHWLPVGWRGHRWFGPSAGQSSAATNAPMVAFTRDKSLPPGDKRAWPLLAGKQLLPRVVSTVATRWLILGVAKPTPENCCEYAHRSFNVAACGMQRLLPYIHAD